ncbi:MAG: DUF6088 family protein [Bacteroidetes bacterium]|nr:DUF6088 family protein [Bacteroidota bacterium]
MNKLETLKSHLKRGNVYRRGDLVHWTKAVDRHLKELLNEGTLKKVSPGVYYYPKRTDFGLAPADETSLVRTFLKDDRFLLTTPNLYNSLGVGTTQLYNKWVVYNHKRHGDFKLGNRTFSFKVKPHFPKKLTQEFLLIDLVNNLDNLAEEKTAVLKRVTEKVKQLDTQKVRKSLLEYGSERAKKLLSPVLAQVNHA